MRRADDEPRVAGALALDGEHGEGCNLVQEPTDHRRDLLQALGEQCRSPGNACELANAVLVDLVQVVKAACEMQEEKRCLRRLECVHGVADAGQDQLVSEASAEIPLVAWIDDRNRVMPPVVSDRTVRDKQHR